MKLITPIQLAALLAIANMKPESRAEIVPSDYFGIIDEVEALLKSPLDGMAMILTRYCGVKDWDRKSSVWSAINDAAKEDCRINFVVAKAGVSERRMEDAVEIVRYDKALPGVLPLATVEKAKAVILSTGQ